MLYVTPEERGNSWYDDEVGTLHQASPDKTDEKWLPYESGHRPVLIHGRHVYHEKCIIEYLEASGTPANGSIYCKIFSRFLPCVQERPAWKGECPTCRESILSSRFVQNTALIGEVGADDEVPIPKEYDPNATYDEEAAPRRNMMEIAFLLVVLYLTATVMAIGEVLGINTPEHEGVEINHSVEAAKWFRLNRLDFTGFETVAESFFLPEIRA